MLVWRPVTLVGSSGRLRAPGQVVDELRELPEGEGIVFTGHRFGQTVAYGRLLCHHLAGLGRPWAIESVLDAGHDAPLLRLAHRSGCRALLLGPDPDPLPRDGVRAAELGPAAAALRRMRRAGLLTVVHCVLGRPGDDAGVFSRAVRLCTAGRVAFPRLAGAEGGAMSAAEVGRGLAWARRALHTHRAVWRRTGVILPGRRAALVANYRARRAILAQPPFEATPAMRLARALARPIRIRERVPFVSPLVGAVQAGGDQVRSAWLRARAVRDDARAALVIRLEGTIDARAARTLVARVRRAVGRTPERIVVDLGGLERISLTVLTRFLEEHAGRLGELRGRLAFHNLRPALAALRDNLHGMLPHAALLSALEDVG